MPEISDDFDDADIVLIKKCDVHLFSLFFFPFIRLRDNANNNSIGGSLIDCLETAVEPETVLKIIYQATKAVSHMHAQTPSIIHRDIKIENFLLDIDGALKLCDFGSATTDIIQPDESWSAQQRNTLEDQLQNVTTPIYRCPEQLDLWTNYQIGTKCDIWALGCMLYYLCYLKHPYEDAAKLRIINANYVLPSNAKYQCFNDIIRGCFQVDPAKRFDGATVLDRLAAISETMNWPLKGPINLKVSLRCRRSKMTFEIYFLFLLQGKPIETPPNVTPNPSPMHSANQRAPPPRPSSSPAPNRPSRPAEPPRVAAPSTSNSASNPVPSQQAPPHRLSFDSYSTNNATAAGSGLFSSLKGGAGSLFKNIKDTSSKVIQTVQQSIARTDLDISSITSRILVMPCPSEGLESAYKTNNIEDVKIYVESRYAPAKVSVYNFGSRSCARLPPPVRTVEASFVFPLANHAPLLQGMYSLAEDMFGFLAADPKSIVIIQSADNGRSTAAVMTCALLIYGHLVREPEDAMQIFAVKRQPPNMRPSQIRYLYYLADIVRTTPHLPHYKPITLTALTCSPVPRTTKARDGCRLYIEIACHDKVVMSTIQEYDKMRLHHASEGQVTVNLNATICGDFTVTLYHARNALKGMGRPQGIKVCQFQMHTGFISEHETLIHLDRSELDDLMDNEHIPANFTVSVPIQVGDVERPPSSNPPWIAAKAARNPMMLFSTQLEYEENVDNFSEFFQYNFPLNER